MTPDSYIDKVRALLNKAESTPFAEEAEALTAKAQELMAKYAITEAMLAAASAVRTDKITTTAIVVKAPYSEAKAALVFAIVDANRCEAVYWGSAAARRIELVGYQSDLENVRLLHASLEIQAINALSAAVMLKPRTEHGKTFSNSFLHAYASRIRTRLKEATQHATTEYEVETGTSTALVLLDRSQHVTEALDIYHPNRRTKSVQFANWSNQGAEAGRRAADGAQLAKGIGNNTKGALR